MPNQIVSTGSYLPKLVVSNDDLSTFLDTSDEWISTRCGINTRHIATDETTSDMATNAARNALEKSGLSVDDIDLVICATITPDTCVPMVASNVKRDLGIASAAAFDLNANCSGFVYAITVADSLMKCCGYKHAIIIGADTNSQIIDWTDRATCVLFGDGAGAVVLSNTENKGIMSTYLDCQIDTDGFLSCFNRLDKTPFSENQRTDNVKITMNGSRVMRFAVKALSKSVKTVAKKSGVSVNDIKVIIPHQANVRILNSAAKNLGIDVSKFYINIDATGNTSSSSIPVALDEVVSKKLIKKGDLIVLVAFGGGLSSGATLIEW